MKSKSGMLRKLLASCASVAVIVGSLSTGVLADVAQSGRSDYVGFDVQEDGFNVFGASGAGDVITTFGNDGYGTVLKVGDNQAVNFNSFEYGKDYTSDGVSANITASIDDSGRAVLVSYNITNSGDSAKTVKIGSYTDCKLNTNDSAPIRLYNGNGLSMSDGTNYFYIVPGNGDFTTMWSGRYSGANGNVFNNSAEHNFSGDSGLAWSWTVELDAGASVTKVAKMEADFVYYNLSFDANGGTGTMDSLSFVSGLDMVAPDCSFTRRGYDFIGWADSADATEPDYYERDRMSITSDTTVYAVWEIDDSYATASEEPEGRDLTYNGEAQALAVAGSSDTGTIVYSLSEEGPFTTDIPTATASGTYTVYYMIEGDDNHDDSDVYSVETEIAKAYITATIDGTEYELEADAELALPRPNDLTREGYDFGGWYSDEACENAFDFDSPVGINDVTLYPKWIAISYALTGGSNAEYIIGSSDGLTFRAERNNNGGSTFSHFTGVKVDGNLLGEANYTAVSGSVIVTLSVDYLKTLAAGEHTIEIMFDDASSVTTIFTLRAEATPTPAGATPTPAGAVAATGETQTSIATVAGILMITVATGLVIFRVFRKEETL